MKKHDLLSKLPSLLINSTVLGGAQTLAIKVGGAVLTLAMFNLAARVLNEETFGHLAIWFNIASFLAVCAVFGQDTLIVRSWNEYGNGRNVSLAKGAYIFGWVIAGSMALLVILSLWMCAKAGLFYAGQVSILTIMAFILAQTLLHYSSHACRTISCFRTSEFNREIVWRAVTLGSIFCAMASVFVYDEQSFFVSAAFGMGIAVVLQYVSINRAFRDEFRETKPKFRYCAWLRTSFGLWSSAVLEAASQYIDVVLVGLLVHPIVAGGYFIVVRIANVFPMLAAGVYGFLVSRMATHFYDGKKNELQVIIRQAMLVATIGSLGLVFLIVIWGEKFLALFGQEYVPMYGPLLILIIATAAFTLTGPHSVLLLITGHERLYMRALFIFFVARMAMVMLFVPLWGVWGAVLAWSCTAIPLGIWLVRVCWLRLGIDPSVINLCRFYVSIAK